MQRIKQHKVNHGDIMTLDVKKLYDGKPVDVFYSDPPWGEGNLKYWQTINNRMTGAERKEVNHNAFLNRIMQIASNKTLVNGPVIIEYGIRWRNEIISLAQSHGLKHNKTVVTYYRSGNKLLPLELHFFNMHNQIPTNYYENIKDSIGYNIVKKALGPLVQQGTRVSDLCCGMGYAAQCTKDNGGVFFGNELNKARLEKTIKRLQK